MWYFWGMKSKAVKFLKVFFKFALCLIIGANVGKWVGLGLFHLIMWLGIMPYLEKFFGWFVF